LTGWLRLAVASLERALSGPGGPRMARNLLEYQDVRTKICSNLNEFQ
jgi:hypothetical protein